MSKLKWILNPPPNATNALGFTSQTSLSATHTQMGVEGLLLAQGMSKALATHAKSFSTNSAASPNRPRWLYIAHTRNLAVGSKVPEKSGQSVVPAANGRSYRSGSNGYKTSRWTPNRNDRQPTPGRTVTTGTTAHKPAVVPLHRGAPDAAKSQKQQFWKTSNAN